MPHINGDRLLQDLRELRTFGAATDHPLGVVRPTFSAADMASRSWLIQKLQKECPSIATAEVDGVGNVIAQSRNPGPVVLLGSHTDTQPTGGWLDGALGVMYALETVRTLAEDPKTSHLAVDMASWADEEGSYLGMLGSSSFCGFLDEADVEAAVGGKAAAGGEPLTAALERCGLKNRHRCHANDPRREYVGYLEAHIEQGPYLEKSSKRIGVVTGIVGLRGVEIVVQGEANHAGTTPMHMRKDAGMATLEIGARINASFKKIASPVSVWTFGEVQFLPGSHSIIPAQAKLALQFRDQDAAQIKRFQNELESIVDDVNAAGVVKVHLAWSRTSKEPASCDADLAKHIAAAAEKHATGNWIHMPSGAAHDAQMLAKIMPSAMLFVPSIKGISHNFEENTSDEDIVLGCQVFTDSVVSILSSRNVNAKL